MTGLHFWAKGYCVSTVGLNEEAIRRFIREQEKWDAGQDSFEFGYYQVLREFVQ